MSRAYPADQPFVRRTPEEQLKYFADLYRHTVNPVQLAWFTSHVVSLGFNFSEDELVILAALDSPGKVQKFLNTQIYYNDDHNVEDVEETAMPPRMVLRTAMAHCFEGALFAYAVNSLHRHNPRWLLLESSQDPDHNLVVFQDAQTGLYGANAHSSWPFLDGRTPEYATSRALAESYAPYYISDLTRNSDDLTLVGYSEPFDLTAKFGVEWIGATESVWDIYYTYVDDTVRFHYLFDDSGKTHLYPLVRALKEKWIQADATGKVFVSIGALPSSAQALWNAFWREYDAASQDHPRGRAREIQDEFMRLTGTTPPDLVAQADEFVNFLAHGQRVERLLTNCGSG